MISYEKHVRRLRHCICLAQDAEIFFFQYSRVRLRVVVATELRAESISQNVYKPMPTYANKLYNIVRN